MTQTELSKLERKHIYPDNPRTISLFSVSSRHPLNVKPAGNSLLSKPSKDDTESILSREQQMGFLSIFPDELILHLLSYISDELDLMALSHTSRVMYAYLYDEEVWKKLYVSKTLEKESDGQVVELNWRGSWRTSMLNIRDEDEANLQLPINLVCSDALYRPFQCSQINYLKLFARIIKEEERYHKDSVLGTLGELPNGRIQRLREETLDLEQFNTKWHNKPFIITNSEENRWPKWDLETLLERFPNVKFRQEAVQWDLSSYSRYLNKNKDESPLYLFDCRSEAMTQLRTEYIIPEIFQYDLFSVFHDEKVTCRPDYAWLIVGPARSGSTFHKDPNHTSAWNTSLTGRKLWIMLPPDITPPGVGTDDEESEVTSPVGIAEWVISGFFNDCLKIEECLIGVTFPNECMHVPSGWWHSVINIDDSVALTQNFVPLPKLANCLNFFKNKGGQISGFRPSEVRDAIDGVLDSCGGRESLKKLKEYCETYDSLKLGNRLQTEDCGEIKASELPPMPIFELFEELLIKHGKDEELQSALAKLNNKESLPNSEVKSQTWEKLKETESKFSFGFSLVDESDDENI